MLSDDIITKIKDGEINSRRQLYKIVGRSKEVIEYLNTMNLLIPETKSRIKIVPIPDLNTIIKQIIKHIIKYKRLPCKEDIPNWGNLCKKYNRKFSEIFEFIDLTGIQYYYTEKYGKIYKYDNKVYLSHSEYIIGKYLTNNNIKFEKEVEYNGIDLDFYLPDYDLYIVTKPSSTAHKTNKSQNVLPNVKRTELKTVVILEIYKHDNTIKKLDTHLKKLDVEVQRL